MEAYNLPERHTTNVTFVLANLLQIVCLGCKMTAHVTSEVMTEQESTLAVFARIRSKYFVRCQMAS